MVSHALRERGMRERITKADEARKVVTRAILVTARNCGVYLAAKKPTKTQPMPVSMPSKNPSSNGDITKNL
jgi:hypothetical protein